MPWRERCEWRRSRLKPVIRRFHKVRFGKWSRPRRLLARVEVIALSTHVRFIVTSLEGRGKTPCEMCSALAAPKT